jgi:DNA-binding NarL/FixJ family response regulator
MNWRKRSCASLTPTESERLWLTIHQRSCRSACELLELDPAIDLVARAGKGGEAIETVMKTKPDMVLMDVNMPYLDGLTLAWFFAHRFPSVRVVLMSTDESPELRKACEDAGAFDFVHKENFRQEFDIVMQRFCADS